MTSVVKPFNTPDLMAMPSGHRRVVLVCPGCKQQFSLKPGAFAARTRASKGRPLCCSRSCSTLYAQDADKAARAAQRRRP